MIYVDNWLHKQFLTPWPEFDKSDGLMDKHTSTFENRYY